MGVPNYRTRDARARVVPRFAGIIEGSDSAGPVTRPVIGTDTMTTMTIHSGASRDGKP
jgi:hypothetical protein